jgi:hypothetical protein
MGIERLKLGFRHAYRSATLLGNQFLPEVDMTTGATRVRKGTLERKLKEQALATCKGIHVRWLNNRDMEDSRIKTRLACTKAALGQLQLLSETELAEFLEGWSWEDVKVICEQVALRDRHS